MLDYGNVFSKALYEKLKCKIHADIRVRCTKYDTLDVVISRKDENLYFKFQITDFSNKVLHAYTTDYALYEILGKYKKYIQNMTQRKYFKTEPENRGW